MVQGQLRKSLKEIDADGMNAQGRKKRRQTQACIIHSGTTRYVLYFIKDKEQGSLDCRSQGAEVCA